MDIRIVQLRQRAERPVLDPLSRRSLRCSRSGRAMPVVSGDVNTHPREWTRAGRTFGLFTVFIPLHLQ